MIAALMAQGGWVMWPLLALSVVGLTLIFERAWYWLATNNPWRRARFQRVGQALRAGRVDEARAIVAADRSVYGQLVGYLLDQGVSDAAAIEAIDLQRSQIERFMPTLGTIITAAPMLGILGTVTGIMQSLQVLGDETITDPSAVAAGIATALLTTVVGLVIALIVLFPYNVYKAQIDRALGRMESLIAAAQRSEESAPETGAA